jgi:hypothetical protein
MFSKKAFPEVSLASTLPSIPKAFSVPEVEVKVRLPLICVAETVP